MTAFQRSAGLVADGIAGPKTQAALQKADISERREAPEKPGWLVLAEGEVGVREGAGAANTVALPNNSAFEMSCKMVSRSTTTQDAAVFTLDNALFTRGASASSGASGKLTAGITADATLGAASITLTASSGTWNAVARCSTTEVQ